MANSKTSTDLTQGSVVGTLMKFAVPLALTSVLQVVYGIVDTIIAGRVLGSSALSAVTNASFLMLVDDLARCLTTSEIPLGILTALVGAPLFLYLIVKGGARDAA